MKITIEDLVSSLLSIGYNEVNQTLFTNAMKIVSKEKLFKLVDYSISKIFNNHNIVFTGTGYKLSNQSSLPNVILNRNEALTNYLINNGFGEANLQVSNKPKTKELVMKVSN